MTTPHAAYDYTLVEKSYTKHDILYTKIIITNKRGWNQEQDDHIYTYDEIFHAERFLPNGDFCSGY